MGIKRIVKSKETWIGLAVGAIAGNWILSTTGRLTGVNVSLPKVRS
jgi:hypothetical protein